MMGLSIFKFKKDILIFIIIIIKYHKNNDKNEPDMVHRNNFLADHTSKVKN